MRSALARMATVGTFLVVLTAFTGAVQDTSTRWSFEGDAGSVLRGWTLEDAGRGTQPGWTVHRDGQARVLAHPARQGRGYDLAVAPGLKLRNLTLSVRMRAISGEKSGGIVWRYRDADNYYLARLNLSERNVRLFKIVRGNRVRLEGEDGLELDDNGWHTLKVRHRGDRLSVSLNGIPIGDERDDTFESPGPVGLWTTADSGVWFDDLTAEPIAR